MPTIAFIESNTSGTGRILAEKALARGYEVAFLSGNPGRYPYVAELMLHPILVDTQDNDAILSKLRGLDDLKAVISSSEYYLESAAIMAKTLGLAASSAEAIQICRDKWRLRDCLAQHNCAVPLTTRVETEAQADACWDSHRHPVVVKPLSGSGSIDVQLHTEKPSYMEHVRRLLRKTTNERGQTVKPVLLVQDMLQGQEYSVEVIGTESGYNLVGITKKYLGEAPFFIETGHDFPAPLSDEEHLAIKNMVCASLDAVGLTFGPSHTELRVENGVPTIIEINPRLGGGMIPVLIQDAIGVDVLEAILDLYLGEKANLEPSHCSSSSIGFFIPPKAGVLAAFELPKMGEDWVVETFLKKKVGDTLVRDGDFRDRIGHVIVSGQDAEESRNRALSYLASVKWSLDEPKAAASAGPGADTGRLKRELHPEAMAIVRKPPNADSRRRDLQCLAAIDEAHLLMLVEEGILPAARVSGVLKEIARQRRIDFGTLTKSIAPRGTYLLYENALIAEIGVDSAGVTHTGRSRNDINASMFRLNLRRQFQSVYRGLWRLRSALLKRASQTLDVSMPVYSQFQPGLPGTFGYYLMGLEQALHRDQLALQHLLKDLNTCPLGSCAGGGTPFPINTATTAKLLGFTDTTRNALDGVASRDLSLRLMSAVAVSAMHITRLAQDFQLWTTREFSFLELPDNLCGGSSMMPQKKNPYLLEMVKGRATRTMGHLAASTGVMFKTPFSNSVESGTEAMSGVAGNLQSFEEAAILMSLIVDAAQVNQDSMNRSARDGVVCASLVTDTLVANGDVAFRTAHHQVGAAITDALDNGNSAEAAVLDLVSDAGIGESPLEWSRRYEFGGGPGYNASRSALKAANSALNNDASWLRSVVSDWDKADQARTEAVSNFLRGQSE